MIKYTFVYNKDNQEVSQTVDYATEPTFEELKSQMATYEPDSEVNYIREDV